MPNPVDKEIIIVGAGPMALYLAIRLRQEGIKASDILIIDPRAGEYYRPGHINADIFQKMASLLIAHGAGSLNLAGLRPSNAMHIKEMERGLYEILKRDYGVDVSKKRFISLTGHQKQLTVEDVASKAQGETETLSAQHVFDVTGVRRAVCHSVNQVLSNRGKEAFFQIKNVYQHVIIPHHLVANISIDSSKAIVFDTRLSMTEKPYFTNKREEFFAMEQLRSYGWKRAVFPTFYHKEFDTKSASQREGMQKYCFYMEAPSTLPKEKYDEYITFMLRVYSYGSVSSFKHLKDSRNPAKALSKRKVRVQHYEISPTWIENYGGLSGDDDFPTVIPIGDAQITPDSRKAHGVKDGLDRVEDFFSSITISELGSWDKRTAPQIVNFDNDEYVAEAQGSMDQHKRELIEMQQERESNERQQVNSLIEAYKQEDPTGENLEIQETLRTFKAIDAYYQSETLFDSLNISKAREGNFGKHNSFDKAQSLLKQVIDNLSSIDFSYEVNNALKRMMKLSDVYKDAGKTVFKKGEYAKAADYFERSLAILDDMGEHLEDKEARTLNTMTLLSNLLISHINNKHYDAAISFGERAFTLMQSSSVDDAIDTNIVGKINLRFLKAHIEKVLSTKNTVVAKDILANFEQSHYRAFSKPMLKKLAEDLKVLAKDYFKTSSMPNHYAAALVSYELSLAFLKEATNGNEKIEPLFYMQLEANILLCHLKSADFFKAIEFGTGLIEKYAKTDFDGGADLFVKIKFRLVSALLQQVKASTGAEDELLTKAQALIDSLPSEQQHTLTPLLKEAETRQREKEIGEEAHQAKSQKNA